MLKGKIAVITGAAGGLGSAIARRFADNGATVVMTDLDVTAVERAAQGIAGARCMRHDVTREDDWIEVVAQAERLLGRVDIVVNNAGLIRVGNIEDVRVEDWNAIMNVCALGAMLGCKHGMGALRRAGGGSLINISSISALRGRSYIPAYAAAKGAVAALTKAVAIQCMEEGNAIRCNSVHPGAIDTPMLSGVSQSVGEGDASTDTKPGVFGLLAPGSVADSVLFLASDLSAHVNGVELVVDDGVCAR